MDKTVLYDSHDSAENNRNSYPLAFDPNSLPVAAALSAEVCRRSYAISLT